MRKRTKSRECALQILYTADLMKDNPEDTMNIYWENNKKFLVFKDFSNSLVRGFYSHSGKIDEIIRKYAENWKLERMAVVDRNILRIAVFELLYLAEIPPKVSINEAVNLAKKFSTSESGRFVNGILDKIHHKEAKIAES